MIHQNNPSISIQHYSISMTCTLLTYSNYYKLLSKIINTLDKNALYKFTNFLAKNSTPAITSFSK